MGIPFYAAVLDRCYAARDLVSLLRAHARILTAGLAGHDLLRTKLCAAYARCDRLREAILLFSFTARRPGFLYNSLIRAHADRCQYASALSLFELMLSDGVPMNAACVASTLRCVSAVASLRLGRRLHSHAIVSSLVLQDPSVPNSLISMYSSCGDLPSARKVFDKMHQGKNLISYTSMIGALGTHGHSKEAFGLFEKILEEGERPDSKAITAVLAACAREGMVEEGRWIFRMIREKRFGDVSLGVEHYTCMVDLLGTAGLVEEAEVLIEGMDGEPDEAMLGALLKACQAHKRFDRADRVWAALLEACRVRGRSLLVGEASHVVYRELQSLPASIVSTKYRTGYHFQPPKNWINGPMYYNGIYHLFYQYNPNGSVWGNIIWAHSVSSDLINWIPLEPGIYPSKPFDINGTWSGSATILPGNKPVIFYTGIDPNNSQVQNIAFPKNLSDPYLREWIKPDYNPVIQPDASIEPSKFRDPTTGWLGPDKRWRVVIGSRRKMRGMAVLYRSKDFVHWIKAKHPLHSSKNTGMWECPDFFPVSLKGKRGLDTSEYGPGVKHVLKVSLDVTRYEYYTVGKYHHMIDRYVPDNTSADDHTGLRYDYGNFYASKTFFDLGKQRRILWGWSNESDTASDDQAKGWAGIQSDVEVSFEVSGLDKAEPFDEKWTDPQVLCGLKGAAVKGGVGPFGLLVLASGDLKEQTAVLFRVFKAPNKHVVLMCHDPSKSSLRPNLYKPSFAGFVDVDISKTKKISLRTLIDHSVVESFGAEGKTCITSRVYPSLAIGEDAHLYVFNNGLEEVRISNLNAWEMTKPRMNT
ncbi:hypothetical protein J5N97_012179 [Dioscorea zingiberensis]|uniref:Glycosyl hydrolase family 32 N-terminal domain-containing protein n=1 Tax=Dioscorea zingiberensis TaxID=325984 RepID=A0A9D5CQZ7_9LILI|nr:hypothetical protein J5N97_012179 [Dioscorea zingiberensis]